MTEYRVVNTFLRQNRFLCNRLKMVVVVQVIILAEVQ